MSIYNAQINYFSVVQLMLEMPKEGLSNIISVLQFFLGFIKSKVSVESLRLLPTTDRDTKLFIEVVFWKGRLLKTYLQVVYIAVCVLKFCVELFNIMKDKKDTFDKRNMIKPPQLIKWITIGLVSDHIIFIEAFSVLMVSGKCSNSLWAAYQFSRVISMQRSSWVCRRFFWRNGRKTASSSNYR